MFARHSLVLVMILLGVCGSISEATGYMPSSPVYKGDGPSGGYGDPIPAAGFMPSFPVHKGDGPSGGYGDPIPHNVYPDLKADNMELWRLSMIHSLEYFNFYAWDAKSRSYSSDINILGHQTSDRRYIIAASRMIYGLAHGSEVYPPYLQRAEAQAHFVIWRMIKYDAKGPYFLKVVNSDGSFPQGVSGNEPLIVNEQAYGIGGLLALFQRTHDRTVLMLVRNLFDVFLKRFYDRASKGFFDEYDLIAGTHNQTKSYNSTVYVATAFLLELAGADTERRSYYEGLIAELADIVTDHFLDPKTGWLIENFDANWNPDWRGWQKQGDYTISPVGHNFQAAWFLLRASQLPVLNAARVKKYQDAAKSIIDSMLSKPGIDRVNGGVYDSFIRETSQPMWGKDKAWWQQAEAILALTLAEKMGVVTSPDALNVRDQILRFYFEKFVAPDEYMSPGGEYKTVHEDGSGDFTQPKGEMGKSTYHTVELATKMREYASFGCSHALERNH